MVLLCREVLVALRCEGSLDMKDSSVADRMRKQVSAGAPGSVATARGCLAASSRAGCNGYRGVREG